MQNICLSSVRNAQCSVFCLFSKANPSLISLKETPFLTRDADRRTSRQGDHRISLTTTSPTVRSFYKQAQLNSWSGYLSEYSAGQQGAVVNVVDMVFALFVCFVCLFVLT